jgi:hypothetical protein
VQGPEVGSTPKPGNKSNKSGPSSLGNKNEHMEETPKKDGNKSHGGGTGGKKKHIS